LNCYGVPITFKDSVNTKENISQRHDAPVTIIHVDHNYGLSIIYYPLLTQL